MKPELREFVKNSSLELLVYAGLVLVYFFLVLHLLGGWLAGLFNQNRTLYAFVALILMLLQGVALELLTSALMRFIRSLRRQ